MKTVLQKQGTMIQRITFLTKIQLRNIPVSLEILEFRNQRPM